MEWCRFVGVFTQVYTHQVRTAAKREVEGYLSCDCNLEQSKGVRARYDTVSDQAIHRFDFCHHWRHLYHLYHGLFRPRRSHRLYAGPTFYHGAICLAQTLLWARPALVSTVLQLLEEPGHAQFRPLL